MAAELSAPTQAPGPEPFPSRREVLHSGRPHRLLGALGWLAVAVAAYLLLDRAGIRAVPGNSDGATVVLEAKAMLSGNLTLAHWTLSYDSFWTLDALFYVVAVALVGLRHDLLTAVPAALATLVVITGMAVARQSSRGRGGLAGPLTVFALLALPVPVLAYYLVQGPLHVATTLACLLAFAALRRGRFGPGWVVGVVLLAVGLLGDLQTLTLGVAPVLAAAGLAAGRTRRLAAGSWLAAAALAAGGLAALGRWLLDLAGGFRLASVNPLATPHRVLANLGELPSVTGRLLGLLDRPAGVPFALELARALALAVLLAGVVSAVGRLVAALARRRGRALPCDDVVRLDDLLLAGVAGSVGTFAALTLTDDPHYARYLVPALVYASVLAGRWVARLANLGVGRRATAGATVLTCLLGAGFGLSVAGAPARDPALALSRFLERHRLTEGLGDYWSSSLVTVDSGGAVTVRPVIALRDGRLVRYYKQSSADWYRGARFQFLVYDPALPWGLVNGTTEEITWGTPRRAYAVGSYIVAVFRRPVRVAAALPRGATARTLDTAGPVAHRPGA